MKLIASYDNGVTPNWELFIDQNQWWKVIWEQAKLPDGTALKRTRSFYFGKAIPNTPEYHYRLERFGP